MRSSLTLSLVTALAFLAVGCAAEGGEFESPAEPYPVNWDPDSGPYRPTGRSQDAGRSAVTDVGVQPTEVSRPSVVQTQVEPTDSGVPVADNAPVCVPELCGNHADDDCDGRRDCDDPDCATNALCPARCVEQVFTCEIPSCNDHDGSNESACRARGNRGGCDAEQLLAWCTRRVSGGHLWDEIHRRWVAERCRGGTVLMRGNAYECRAEVVCKTWRCVTPLVLLFNPVESVRYHPQNACGRFDLSSGQDGSGTSTDWPTAATPWLARDLDRDGAITSGRELFGSATALGDSSADDGFAALGALDSNGDGVVNRTDPGFAELVVWADADGDRVSDPGEVRSLASFGVLALEVHYRISRRCDLGGNCELERARFWFGDPAAPSEGALVDVHLAVH